MNSVKRPESIGGWLAERIVRVGTLVISIFVVGVLIVWLLKIDPPRSTSQQPQLDAFESDTTADALPLSVRALAVSSDGQYIDAIRGDSTWRRHDAYTGGELAAREIEDSSQVQASVRSAGELVASIEIGNRVEVKHPFKTLLSDVLPDLDPGEQLARCALAQHKNLMAVISEQGSLWMIEFNDEAILSVRHDSVGDRLGSVALSPDGRFVALTDGALLIWDVQQRKITRRSDDSENQFVAWSDDGSTLITLGSNSTIKIWDAQLLTLLQQFTATNHTITTAAISAAGRFVAVADSDLIRIWDVQSGQEIASLSGHQVNISALQFSDDERALFSADFHGELRRWSLIDGREIWCVQ